MFGLIAIVGVLALLLWPSSAATPVGTALPGLRVGQLAPDFSLANPSGRRISLKDLRGRTVLLNFWATTCGPCRTEMPALEHAYRSLALSAAGAHRLAPVIVGIDGALEDGPTIARFGRRQGVSYPLLLDSNFEVTIARYHVPGLPTTIVLDSAGRIRLVHLGPLSYPAIVRAVGQAR